MGVEQPPNAEAGILDQYNHMLVADPRQYAIGRDDGNYIRVQKPFTTAVRDELLRGRLTIALYCLTSQGLAVQGVVDSDKPDGIKDLQRVGLQLRELGLTPLLEASARGGHLRIFHEPADPDVTVNLLQQILSRTSVDAEVFPRGRGLSSVRAPLARHPLTKRQYPFLHLDTLQPVALETMGNLRHLASFRRATYRELAEALGKALSAPRKRPPTAEGYIAQGAPKPDIVEVVGADRTVQKVGKNFRALCPFHADTKPSLVLYPETNTYFCFSCRSTGDSIHYLAQRQGVRDGDILRQLRG